MDESWKRIYWLGFDRAELEDEIDQLKAQLKKGAGLFSSQTEGGASYTKDLIALRNRLEAACYVLSEKYGGGSDWRSSGSGVADFSNFEVS